MTEFIDQMYYKVKLDGAITVAKFFSEWDAFQVVGSVTFFPEKAFDEIFEALNLEKPSGVQAKFPTAVSGYNKVAVIKAVRGLTHWGLKEAKCITETGKTESLEVCSVLSQSQINDLFEELRSHGVVLTNIN